MKNPALEDLHIASPCNVPWDGMKGDDRKRFCDQCSLHVYDLSGLTRNAAESLVKKSEGNLCVRMFVRKDGTVLTKDCPVGLAKVKRRLRGVAAALFGLLTLGACSFGEKTQVRAKSGATPTTVPANAVSVPEEELLLLQGDIRVPEFKEVEPLAPEPRPLMGRPMLPPETGK